MNLNEFTSRFTKLENDLGLLADDFRGTRYWERLRFSIHQGLAARLEIIGSRRKKKSRLSGLINTIELYAFGFLQLVWRGPFCVGKKDLLIFSSVIQKKETPEGYFYGDDYVDLFFPFSPFSHLTFKPSVLPEKMAYVRPASFYSLDLFEVLGRLFRAIYIRLYPLSGAEKDKIFTLEKRLKDEFSVDFPLEALIFKAHYRRLAQRFLYRRLLKHARPKVVIFVCAYFRENVVEVCKEMGIPTVELQHGVINTNHPGYHFPHLPKQSFPDYLFTFGEFWSTQARFPIAIDRVIPIGFPRIEVRLKKRRKEQTGGVLFLGQETTGDKLTKLAVELSRVPGFNREIFYKVHPLEVNSWRSRYPELLNSTVKVIDTPRHEIYDSFEGCEFQVSVYSTAVFEGVAFGLKTILFNIGGIEYMQSLLNSGAAKLVSDVGELEVALRSSEWRVDQFREKLFKDGSVENFQRAVKEIIGKAPRSEVKRSWG